MTSIRRLLTTTLAVGVLASTVVLGGAPWARAATGQRPAPAVEVEPAGARAGEVIRVRLVGWRSVAATVTVCGNLARRGAVDCDVRRGQGVPLAPTGGTASTELLLHEPPVPCPCVVRAASGSFDEVAVAPIDIVGAPTAPVVESDSGEPLVEVFVEAHRAPKGIVDAARASLGGPARYEVEVTVRNLTAAPLAAVRLAGSATRSGREVASFGTSSRPLPAAAVHVHRAVVEIPAPGIGALRWQAIASGAGPVATHERPTSDTPVALLALAALLAGDLLAMGLRRSRRRRALGGGWQGALVRRRRGEGEVGTERSQPAR